MLNTIIQHFLVFTLCIIAPLTNVIILRNIKENPQAERKEKAYISIYFAYWIFTAMLLLVYPFHDLFFPKYPFHFPWWISAIMVLIFLWGIQYNVLPQLLFRRNESVRNTIIENYNDESYIFPKTVKQQRMMVFVAVTVGVCEEIIFRGFINNYLHEQFGLSIYWSFMLAAVIFGLGHFSQGIEEIGSATVFGIVMGFMYIITGSLLLPIIIHVVYDLKIVTMTRIIQKYEAYSK